MLQETCRVDSAVFHSVYGELPPDLRGSQKQRDAICKLRQNIDLIMKNCADNVKFTLYINDVKIEIWAGKMENEIVTTIEYNGDTQIYWPKKTWSKYLNDGWDKMKQIPIRLLSLFGDFVAEHPYQFVDVCISVLSNFRQNRWLPGGIRGLA